MRLAARYPKFYTFIISTLKEFKCLLIVEGHFIARMQPKVQGLTPTCGVMTWSPKELRCPSIYYDAVWDTSQNSLASWLMVTSMFIPLLQKHKLVKINMFFSTLRQLWANEEGSRKRINRKSGQVHFEASNWQDFAKK